MSTGLQKFNKKVAAYKRAHPNTSHAVAQQKVKKENKRVGVSGRKKMPKKKKSRPLYKSSVSIGRVKASSAAVKKLRKAHEKEGLLLSQIGSVSVQRSRLRRQYEEQLAWLLLSIQNAKTKTARRRLLKRKSELLRKIRGVS